MELKLYKYVMLAAAFCGAGTGLGGRISTIQMTTALKNNDYKTLIKLVKNNECTVSDLREQMTLADLLNFTILFDSDNVLFSGVDIKKAVIQMVKEAAERSENGLDSLLYTMFKNVGLKYERTWSAVRAYKIFSALMRCSEVNINYSDVGSEVNINYSDVDGKTPLWLIVDRFGDSSYNYNFLEGLFHALIDAGAHPDILGKYRVSILEVVINKFFDKDINHYYCCSLVKTLLFNNAHFDEKLRGKASQDEILKFLFDVVCALKEHAAQGQEDVLTILIQGATGKKQTKDGRTICLSSIDLVNFSIHNNLKKALQHSIKQNELYLQGPAKVMANYQNLPLDMFECFWNLTKDKDRKELLKLAAKRNNKKFLNAVIQYYFWQQKKDKMCSYNDETVKCFDLNFIYKNA